MGRPSILNGFFLVFLSHRAVASNLELSNQVYNAASLRRQAYVTFDLTLQNQVLTNSIIRFREVVSDPTTNAGFGDINDFVAANWNVSGNEGSLSTGSGVSADLEVNLLFQDYLPSGTIDLVSQASQLHLDVTSGQVVGSFASDFDNCNAGTDNSQCSLTAALVVHAIDEPLSATTILLPLIAGLLYKIISIIPKLSPVSKE